MRGHELRPIVAIARRVLIEQLRDYRLVLLGIGTALLLVVGTYMSLSEYAQRVHAFEARSFSSANRNPLESVLLMRTPAHLAFMSDGGENRIPDTLILVPGFLDVPHDDVTSRNLLPAGAALDWSFVLAYVLSLAALMCTADLIVRQRAIGSLRIVMAYPIRRATLLAGEYLGAFAAMVPFVVIGLVAAHALVIGSQVFAWSVEDSVRSAAFAALTLAFVSFVCLVGLVLSTMSPDRTTCLIAAIAFWIVTAVIVPALAGPAAHLIVRTPSPREHHAQLRDLQRRFDSQIFVSSEMLYPLKRPGLTADRQATLAASLQAGLVAQHEAKLLEYKNQLIKVRHDYLARARDEERVAADLSAVSPLWAYRRLSANLAGAGAANQEAFYTAGERFLREYTSSALMLRQQLRSLARVYGPTVEEDGIRLQGVSSVSYAAVPVPPGALPQFQGYEVPLSRSVIAAGEGVLLFLSLDVSLFMIAVYRFNRYVFV